MLVKINNSRRNTIAKTYKLNLTKKKKEEEIIQIKIKYEQLSKKDRSFNKREREGQSAAKVNGKWEILLGKTSICHCVLLCRKTDGLCVLAAQFKTDQTRNRYTLVLDGVS